MHFGVPSGDRAQRFSSRVPASDRAQHFGVPAGNRAQHFGVPASDRAQHCGVPAGDRAQRSLNEVCVGNPTGVFTCGTQQGVPGILMSPALTKTLISYP